MQASFHNHAQNVRARYQSEAELLWRTTWRMPVVGLFLDPKRRCKYRKTSRIYENLAQQKFPECHFLRIFPPTITSSILSAMFTGACGPLEKLSLALVPRSHVLRMIVRQAAERVLALHCATREYVTTTVVKSLVLLSDTVEATCFGTVMLLAFILRNVAFIARHHQ